jgi:ABC-type transporter Mla maintaining outer membrane lipid asymmetry permease subunit MlaE
MAPPEESSAPSLPVRPFGLLDRWIGFWESVFELVGALYWLGRDTAQWMWRAFVVRRVRIGAGAITSQIVRVGVRSISIVMLVSGSIGIILALQTSPTLDQYGQTDKVANLIGVAVFRELGPLVAAIVMVGFAGASIAAELGTMVVGEEVEALEAMGLNPVRYLVVPRLAATVTSLLALAAPAVLPVTASAANPKAVERRVFTSTKATTAPALNTAVRWLSVQVCRWWRRVKCIFICPPAARWPMCCRRSVCVVRWPAPVLLCPPTASAICDRASN